MVPDVCLLPGEDYFDGRTRGGRLNRAVAVKLGWTVSKREYVISEQDAFRQLESSRGMFGAAEGRTDSPGKNVEYFWLDEKGKKYATFRDDGDEALPDWQGDLNEAWPLALRAKIIVPMLKDPREVANFICRAFIRDTP